MDDELSKYLDQMKKIMENHQIHFSQKLTERMLKDAEERIRRLHREPYVRN